MDREHPHEHLNAYLDRELSPDERATVERTLETSAEARQCLNQLEATSRFLRRLPAQQLEADFADSVVDRLRRESLLRPEPEAPKRWSRQIAWGVCGPLAAAAVLLVAVWFNRAPNQSAPEASHGAARPILDDFPRAAPAESLAQDDICLGDVLACGVIVVDVVRAVEKVKALAVQYDIAPDTNMPNASAHPSTAPRMAWIEFTAEREQAGKILGQMCVEASTPSDEPSPILSVTFDRSVLLSEADADERKSPDQPSRVDRFAGRSVESALKDGDVGGEESADKTALKGPADREVGRTLDRDFAPGDKRALKAPANRAAVEVPGTKRQREIEAKEVLEQVIEQSKSPAQAESAALAAGTTAKPAAPSVDAVPKAQLAREPKELNKRALQYSALALDQDRPNTLRVYYSLPEVEKLRALREEAPRSVRKQQAVTSQSHERVTVLLQFQQVPNQDEPPKKRRN